MTKNNQSIHFLRGTSLGINNNSSTILNDGQPLYNIDKNYLTVGGGQTKQVNASPIVTREVIGYVGDTTTIGNSTTLSYRLGYDNTGNNLELNTLNNFIINSNSININGNLKNINIDKNLYNLGAFDIYTSNSDGTGIINRKTGYVDLSTLDWSYQSTENRWSCYYRDIVNGTPSKATNYKTSSTDHYSDLPLDTLSTRWAEWSGTPSLIANTVNKPTGYLQYQLPDNEQYTEKVIEDQPINIANQEEENYWNKEWEKGLNLSKIDRGKTGTNVLLTNAKIGTYTLIVFNSGDGNTSGRFDLSYSGGSDNSNTFNNAITFTTAEVGAISVYCNSNMGTPYFMLVEGTHPYFYQPYNGSIIREKDLNSYLPLSGGTLTHPNSDTALYLKSAKPASYLGYKDKDNNTLGFIGINSSHTPVFNDNNVDYELALSKDTVPNTGGVLLTSLEIDEISTLHGNNGNVQNAGGNISGYALLSALDFRWYDTHYRIGNIRGGATNSDGFGITDENWQLLFKVDHGGNGFFNGSVSANDGYLISAIPNRGTIQIGSQNDSYCHYETTTPAHWFNKEIHVNGAISSYSAHLIVIGSDAKVYDQGERVYSPNNKPTPADIGAYAKPETGIPKEDLSGEVQAVLDNTKIVEHRLLIELSSSHDKSTCVYFTVTDFNETEITNDENLQYRVMVGVKQEATGFYAEGTYQVYPIYAITFKGDGSGVTVHYINLQYASNGETIENSQDLEILNIVDNTRIIERQF